MVSRGMDAREFTWISNGFSIDEISESVALNTCAESRLPDDQFIVGHFGSIGCANALSVLFNAAEMLQNNQGISFVLVDDGRDKLILQAIAADKGLTNIRILDPIPKVQVHEMISKFSVCYIDSLDSDLYKFGIAAKAGLGMPAEDSESLAMAIQQFYKMAPEERAQFGVNGKKVAFSDYKYPELSIRLANALFAND